MVRVKTGIDELDEMLGGGFMKGDAVMLLGNTGTGKTTLALQYLVNGITRFGEHGIYVTFEQLPDQLYRDAKNFNWDLRKLEEENRFRLICTSPNLLLQHGKGEHILDEAIKEIQPTRIVIDSLSHIEMFIEKSALRKEAYRLVMHLKTRGLSSLLISETQEMIGGSSSVAEAGFAFMIDCIVLLKLVEIESCIRKAIVILKMRGSNHDKKLREFEITSQGIKLTAPFSEYEGIIIGDPRRSLPPNTAVQLMNMFMKSKEPQLD
jgi:circadian clock protein KaiC